MAFNYEGRKKALARRKAMAEAMMKQQGQVPQGQMVSGHYVAPNILQALVPAVSAWAGAKISNEADKQEGLLDAERQADLSAQMRNVLGMQQAGDPNWKQAAMASEHEDLRKLAMTAFEEDFKPEKFTKEGMERIDGKLRRVLYGERGTKKVIEGEPAEKLTFHRGAAVDPYSGDVLREGIGYAPAAPQTNVYNIQEPAENEFGKTIGKGRAEMVLESDKIKIGAISTYNMAERLEQLSSNPMFSGPQSDPLTWAGEVARGFGIQVDPRVQNSEEYMNVINKEITNRILAGGRGITDEDRKFILDSYPTLSRTPEGRMRMIQHMKEVARKQVAEAERVEAASRGEFPELDRIQNVTPANLQQLPAQAPAGAPAPGTVEDGYQFMGGDPADPKNWRKQ